VFETVPGIVITERNTFDPFHSEEIDVAFWNDKSRQGLPFLPQILLIECKNWTTPVSSQDVAWFDTKIRHRGQSFGILVAIHGVTGRTPEKTAAHQIIAKALSEQRQLVVVTGEELLKLRDSNDLSKLIKSKLCRLVVSGTALT